MNRFQPAAPQWTPSVAFDTRAAWSGSFPEAPEIPLHIDAAGFQGKPVYFLIAGPWSKPATPEQASGDQKPPGEVVYIVLQLIVMIGSIPFARYNLRLGRGDTRGAVRLGLFCLAVGLLVWVIGGTHVASVKEADLFFMATMRALISAVSVAVTYISFEPFVRRRWPQTLISWSRVLAGTLRDPLVGRDVLVGTAVGIMLALVQAGGSLVVQIGFRPNGADRNPSGGSVGRQKFGERRLVSNQRRTLQRAWHSLLDLPRQSRAAQAVAGGGRCHFGTGWNHRIERTQPIDRLAHQYFVFRADGDDVDALRVAGDGDKRCSLPPSPVSSR